MIQSFSLVEVRISCASSCQSHLLIFCSDGATLPPWLGLRRRVALYAALSMVEHFLKKPLSFRMQIFCPLMGALQMTGGCLCSALAVQLTLRLATNPKLSKASYARL